jgi:23S rRNA pseudouridine1911/1915/1917 synthase
MDSPAEPFAIRYEDEHLLVVDKHAGLVVHPARGHREGTLSQLLAAYTEGGGERTGSGGADAPEEKPAEGVGLAGDGEAAGGVDITGEEAIAEGVSPSGGAEAAETVGGWDPRRPGIVHRLDRDTSGVLVVARSEQAQRLLQQALAQRRIEREYLALVMGRPPARSGTIDAPIGRDPRDRTRMAVGGGFPREARTHFTLERALREHTLLRLRLETGRTHQIRVHLQAIGHPVAGDPVYGAAGALGLERQFLHAARLAFEHPLTGEPIEVRSPLPEDLRRALERAEELS